MHLALVNQNGVTTFYTNGVPCGASDTGNATTSAGDMYIGTPNDNQAYSGYLDEARIFTFAPGAFTTNDLLLRAAGPNLLFQPQSASVWTGGAAPFSTTASFDNSLTYQWYRGSSIISGATSNGYLLPVVATGDSGSTFKVVVTGSGSVTSSVATLTVVAPNPANVAAYRNVITAEPSLIAYFPVDGCSGSVLSNSVNANYTGIVEGNASYDGRTDRSFGQRALSFNADGDVQIQNNPAYEFANGNGTIEAVVNCSSASAQPMTIFSEAQDSGQSLFYSLAFSASGSSLVYSNDATLLTWVVPGGLLGANHHVALVFDSGTNVTPYIDGNSLGTQTQSGFGYTTGGQFWIGAIGSYDTDNRFIGTIDELAIYSTNLSATKIQGHYTKYHYGTNSAPPVIASQPSSKSVLAGGSPVLQVNVTGALPLNFQWKSNNVAIPGANTSSLTISNSTTSSSANYTLTISNVFGVTNTTPIALNFTAPPKGYAAQVMSDNPSAFWRLGESSGSTAVDSVGFNDGTYASSGVTLSAGGFPGDPHTGTRFDGNVGRAIIPNSSVLNPSTAFTIEFWATLSRYGFFVPVSSMNRPTRDSGYEFYIDGNAAGYEFHTGPGGYAMITYDDHVPATETWSHVVGVYDGTNIFLYVNGQPGDISSQSTLPTGEDNWMLEGTSPVIPDTAEPFYIGSRSDNTHFWAGRMANVAFYNYPMSPTQILNHYNYINVPTFGTPVISSGTLTLPWTGSSTAVSTAVIQQSTDGKTWTAVPGNPNPLVISVKNAPKVFYRIAQ